MEKHTNYIQLPEISHSTPAVTEEPMVVGQPTTMQQQYFQPLPQHPQQLAMPIAYPHMQPPAFIALAPTLAQPQQQQGGRRVEPIAYPRMQPLPQQQQMTPVPQQHHQQQIPPMMAPQLQMAPQQPMPMEYREHVVYAPQEIYKIQSRGTQFAVCPQCRKAVQTVVQYKAGAGTYATGAFIFLAGCWLGCCLAPCMLDDCNDAVHMCPVCAKEVGRKTFLFKC